MSVCLPVRLPVHPSPVYPSARPSVYPSVSSWPIGVQLIVLSLPVLSCPPCPVLSLPVLSCPSLSCPVPACSSLRLPVHLSVCSAIRPSARRLPPPTHRCYCCTCPADRGTAARTACPRGSSGPRGRSSGSPSDSHKTVLNTRTHRGKLPASYRQVTGKLPASYRQVTVSKLPASYRQVTGKLPASYRQVIGKLPASYRQVTGKLTASCSKLPASYRQVIRTEQNRCTIFFNRLI